MQRVYFYNVFHSLKPENWGDEVVKAINVAKDIKLNNEQIKKINCFIMLNNPKRVGAILKNQKDLEDWQELGLKGKKSVAVFVGLAKIHKHSKYLKFINDILKD